jgi:glycosyltransferase involved in cell wall biosynthesis
MEMVRCKLSNPEFTMGTSRSAAAERIAVLVPCYNEALTIGQVVRDFRRELPDAMVFVFDNNSTDGSAAIASAAGAQVFRERRQGKGYVIQSMFRNIDADIYVMVDGDGTYPADAVHKMLEPLRTRDADMVIGSRLHESSLSEFKAVNRLGNQIYLGVLKVLFGVRITDLLSGYRSFSWQLVKSLPLSRGGFQTEAEMTIKTLERGFIVVEVPVNLGTRPPGSSSKIRLVHDGFLIMGSMFSLLRDYKPFTFFGALGSLVMLLALIPGIVVLRDYFRTGLVPHLPSAILAVGLVMSGLILLLTGLILHTIARRFQELDQKLQTMLAEIRRG